MTAAELASFRALLQEQAAASRRPERGWFARFRLRATTDEALAPIVLETVVKDDGGLPGEAPLALDLIPPDFAPAAPPPRSPPAFGRRELDELAVEPARPPPPAVEGTSTRPIADFAPRPRRVFLPPDAYTTPEQEPERVGRPVPNATGVIAGWSQARPPSAQRRVLARLEAVLLAERQGLDARREADLAA